jgi:hypothetical protein
MKLSFQVNLSLQLLIFESNFCQFGLKLPFYGHFPMVAREQECLFGHFLPNLADIDVVPIFLDSF